MSALPVEARSIAGRAADYINQHGWCQGTYHSYETGQVCMIGAIDEAAGGCNRDDLSEYLHGVLLVHPPAWNDDPDRTQADVTGVLYAVEEGWL
jgi:hypothetical protein